MKAALAALQISLRRPYSDATLARLARFEQHPDEDIRLAYLELFTSPYMHDDLRDETEISVWVRHLSDLSPKVRERAAAHFYQCDAEAIDRPFVRQALRRCLNDREGGVRYRAMAVLADLKDRAVVAVIARDLDRLRATAPSLSFQQIYDDFEWLQVAIGNMPQQSFAQPLTAVAETMLARTSNDDLSDPDLFVEQIADLIRACETANQRSAA
jgi:hypothetical protein